MDLKIQTQLASHLVIQLTNLGSAGFDAANHHAFMFLTDIGANSEISKTSLDNYVNDYLEQVGNIHWMSKDIERLAQDFSVKLMNYVENPTEENALNILK